MLSTKNLEKLVRGYITQNYLLFIQTNTANNDNKDTTKSNDERGKCNKNTMTTYTKPSMSNNIKYYIFPKSLDFVIITFCGDSMLLKFDIYLDTFGYMIRDDGRHIKTPTTPLSLGWNDSSDLNSSTDTFDSSLSCDTSLNIAGFSEISTIVTALSNVGWNSGIHEFNVKVIKPGKDAIGITSSLDEIMAWVWIKQSRHNTHYYYGGGSISSSTCSVKKYNCNHGTEWIWKKNDILTVNIDLFLCKLRFYINDIQIGDTVDIEENCTWYPIICVQENNTEYRLIR